VTPFGTDYGLSRRLRPNVYVCAHLSDDELRAARCGGRLDCVSALAALGVPVAATADAATADDGALHLRLAPNDGRSSARRFGAARLIRAHWSIPRFPLPTIDETRRAAHAGAPISRVTMPASDALRQALRTCLAPAEGAAVIADLLEKGLLSADQLARVIASTSHPVRSRTREAGLPVEVDDALARRA
jgi:hypothetical protein